MSDNWHSISVVLDVITRASKLAAMVRPSRIHSSVALDERISLMLGMHGEFVDFSQRLLVSLDMLDQHTPMGAILRYAMITHVGCHCNICPSLGNGSRDDNWFHQWWNKNFVMHLRHNGFQLDGRDMRKLAQALVKVAHSVNPQNEFMLFKMAHL